MDATKPQDLPDIRSVASAELFQESWQTYRKMVDNNYLFHREAYSELRRIVRQEIETPFGFLDIACGDASATIAALKGSAVSRYSGIDISRPALDLAEEGLRALTCPVELVEGDFVEVIGMWQGRVDLVWIGLSLHHLEYADKLTTMDRLRGIVSETGRLVIYENTSRPSEHRDSWLRRWDWQRPQWMEFSDAEWLAVTSHVHASDFPETAAGWHALGQAAGFSRIQEIYAAPTDLFRMYCFQT